MNRLDTHLGTIRTLFRSHDAEAAIITFLPDVRWAVGFSGSSGLLVVTEDAAHFVTDGRYEEQAAQEVADAEIHTPGYRLFEHIGEAGLLGDAHHVLIQGDHLTYDDVQRLRSLLDGHVLEPVSGLLQEVVARKQPHEVERVRAAQAITDAVFDAILPFVQPGMSERDLAAEIVYQHLKRGCEGLAFDPIVASGPRGALPHATPSSKTFRPGELVVIDMGGVLDGYASDMTRTVAVGEPEDDARRAYQAVLDAQQAALDIAAAGMTGKQLDAAARDVLEEAGLAEFFPHSLGHGVGLQTHEWPRLSSRVEDVLPAGATVTVEPGVYVPGRFGIRIEDLIVIREGGYENLTQSPKALLVL